MSDQQRNRIFGDKMTKRQQLTVWLIVLGILGVTIPILARPVLFPNAESDPASTTGLKVMPVNVMRAIEVESFALPRRYTGIVRPQQSTQLGFELGGRIEKVMVDEGSVVKQGQVLATLNVEALVAKKNTLAATQSQSQAMLDELIAGPREETILAARADAQAANAEYQNAQFNSRRRKQLRDSQSISAEEFDQAIFAEKVALARYNSADHRLAELTAGTRVEKIDAARAAVQQLAASILEVDVAIGKSKLTAPFDGTVIRRHLDPGTIANASVPVVQIQHSDLEAWVGLPVNAVYALRESAPFTIWVDGTAYRGEVKAKIREVDSATRTQTVIFKLDPQATGSIVAGQICKLDLPTQVNERGIWLPTTCLTQGVRGLWSVMIVENTNNQPKVAKRDVEIIHTDVDRSLVRGTLQGGDQVIVDGVHRIVTGQSVQPLLRQSDSGSQTSKR